MDESWPSSEAVMKPMLNIANESPEISGEYPRPDCRNRTSVKKSPLAVT